VECSNRESSAITVASPGTWESQNTALSRTSESGSSRTTSSRIEAVSAVSCCEITNTAFSRSSVEQGSRRSSTFIRIGIACSASICSSAFIAARCSSWSSHSCKTPLHVGATGVS
jgi:hypothetical protein